MTTREPGLVCGAMTAFWGIIALFNWFDRSNCFGVSDMSTLRRLTCAPRAIKPKRARDPRAAI